MHVENNDGMTMVNIPHNLPSQQIVSNRLKPITAYQRKGVEIMFENIWYVYQATQPAPTI